MNVSFSHLIRLQIHLFDVYILSLHFSVKFIQVRDLNAVELQDVLSTNISSTFYHTIETSYWKAARLSRGWISIFSSFFAFNDPFAKNAHQFLIQSNTGCNILFCSGQIRSSSDITLAKHFDSENISIGQVLLDAFSKEKNVNAVVNLINSLIGSFVLIFVSVSYSQYLPFKNV